MKRFLRSAARRIAPNVMADRARRYERDFRSSRGIPDLARRLDPVVAAGPSRGLRYPPERFEAVDAPVAKLLGTYELELHPVLEQAVGNGLPFYDIGAADGYWAVGMAVRGLSVTAWDLSADARELCTEVAALNDVPVRLEAEYRGEPIASGLVLCDIEGAEGALLTAEVAMGLPHVVVEVHEDSHPGTGAMLREAFAGTHTATMIEQAPRKPPAAISGWSAQERELALGEFRGPALHWLHFRRR